MVDQTGAATHDDDITRFQQHPLGRIAAFEPAYSKPSVIAERNRDDRRRELLFVAVDVQAKLGTRLIPVDQTGFRSCFNTGQIRPNLLVFVAVLPAKARRFQDGSIDNDTRALYTSPSRAHRNLSSGRTVVYRFSASQA